MAQPEAFSRILVNKALEFSGWDLLNPKQVRFEMSGRSGRADYVISGERGPLAVVEAKKEDVDPYDAKEQARGYAGNRNRWNDCHVLTGTKCVARRRPKKPISV